MNQRQRIRYALRAGGDLTTPGQEAAQSSAARSSYSCLVCQEALTLKAASSTKVTPYFSHAPGSRNGEGHAPESVVHLAAKVRLMAALGAGKPLVALFTCTQLSCPGLATLPLLLPEYDEIGAEVGLEDTAYRLDVALRRAGRAVFAFEARHTHAVGEAKARDLDGSVPWIEFAAEEFAAQGQLRVLDGNLWGGNPHGCLCPACAALKPSERMWASEALEARLWLRSFPRDAELIAQLYVRRLEKGFAALGGVKAKNARAAWFKELAQADETIFEIAFLEHWGEALTPQRCGEGQDWGSSQEVGLGYVFGSYEKPALALRLRGRQIRALWWGCHRRELIEERLSSLNTLPGPPCPAPAAAPTGSWAEASTRHAVLMRLAEGMPALPPARYSEVGMLLYVHTAAAALLSNPGVFPRVGEYYWISYNAAALRIRKPDFKAVIKILLKVGLIEKALDSQGHWFYGLPRNPSSCPVFRIEAASELSCGEMQATDPDEGLALSNADRFSEMFGPQPGFSRSLSSGWTAPGQESPPVPASKPMQADVLPEASAASSRPVAPQPTLWDLVEGTEPWR